MNDNNSLTVLTKVLQNISKPPVQTAQAVRLQSGYGGACPEPPLDANPASAFVFAGRGCTRFGKIAQELGHKKDAGLAPQVS